MLRDHPAPSACDRAQRGEHTCPRAHSEVRWPCGAGILLEVLPSLVTQSGPLHPHSSTVFLPGKFPRAGGEGFRLVGSWAAELLGRAVEILSWNLLSVGSEVFFFPTLPAPIRKLRPFQRPTNETFPTFHLVARGPCRLAPYRKILRLKEEQAKGSVAEPKLFCFLETSFLLAVQCTQGRAGQGAVLGTSLFRPHPTKAKEE